MNKKYVKLVWCCVAIVSLDLIGGEEASRISPISPLDGPSSSSAATAAFSEESQSSSAASSTAASQIPRVSRSYSELCELAGRKRPQHEELSKKDHELSSAPQLPSGFNSSMFSAYPPRSEVVVLVTARETIVFGDDSSSGVSSPTSKRQNRAATPTPVSGITTMLHSIDLK